MQIDNLILKYCTLALERKCEDSEYCFPLQLENSYRIYFNSKDRDSSSYSFVAHGHDYGAKSVIKMLHTDDNVSIYVYSNNIELHQKNGFPVLVKSADEYFNLAISLNLTVPYSLLSELQKLTIKHGTSVSLYMTEIHQNVQKN